MHLFHILPAVSSRKVEFFFCLESGNPDGRFSYVACRIRSRKTYFYAGGTLNFTHSLGCVMWLVPAAIFVAILLLIFIIVLVMFVVYRMRKRDEGSYVLGDPTLLSGQKRSASGTKALMADQEFYA